MLPRSALDTAWPYQHLVPHALSGALWWQALLLTAQAGFALALLLGHRTRIATLGTLLLLFSLQARNPYILNAGDILLRLFLFWGLFLPLGARWSLDARHPAPHAARVFDLATTGLLLQVLVVYALNAFHKAHSGRWWGGDALLYVFRIERYMNPLGELLNHFPALLVLIAKTWYLLLLLSPLLLLATGWLRTALVAVFAGMHLGMFLFMQIGFFPLISMIALLSFLPPHAWDRAEQGCTRLVQITRARFPQRSGDADLPSAQPRPTIPRRALPRGLHGTRHLATGILLVLLLGSASVTAGVVPLPEEAHRALRPHAQRWAMFADPATKNTWLVAPAELASGETHDALHHDTKDWQEPRYIKETYPDFRWRKYLDALTHPDRGGLITHFSEHLCTRWDATHDDKVVHVTIYRVDQAIDLNGPDPEPVRYELDHHQCGT